MGTDGPEPEAEFSSFLALQISNAVSQTLDNSYKRRHNFAIWPHIGLKSKIDSW